MSRTRISTRCWRTDGPASLRSQIVMFLFGWPNPSNEKWPLSEGFGQPQFGSAQCTARKGRRRARALPPSVRRAAGPPPSGAARVSPQPWCAALTCRACHVSHLSRVTLVTCHTCHVSHLLRVTLVTCHTCHVSRLSRVTLVTCHTCYVLRRPWSTTREAAPELRGRPVRCNNSVLAGVTADCQV